MTQLDFDGLGRHLLSRSREILPRWLPNGKMVGAEFHVGNIAGDEGNSLKINCNSGKWADFAADIRGGDLISLYSAINSIKPGEAFKQLSDSEGFDATLPPPVNKPPPSVSEITAPPQIHEAPAFYTMNHGRASATWCYRAENGSPIFHVSRHDPPWPKGATFKGKAPTKKQLFPWTWNAKQSRWAMKHYPAPRPLYGLEELATAGPERWVLLVEGEKAAEAARLIVPDTYVVMTWCGGSNHVSKTNFGPLRDRRVMLWPDADKQYRSGELLPVDEQPGIKTMYAVGEALMSIAAEIRMIYVEHEPKRADGWDAADAVDSGWTWPDVRKWADPLTRPFKLPERPPPDPEERVQLVLGGASDKRPGETDLDDGPPVFSEEEIARDCARKWEHDLRWCNDWGVWLRWNSSTWVRDTQLNTFEDIRKVCARRAKIYADFLEDLDKSTGPARSLATLHYVRAVEMLLRADQKQRSEPDQYDANPYLLGTPGGTVDLQTGKLKKSHPEDYITRRTSVVPSSAKAPVWDAFITGATGGDPDMETYLKRMAGYCLTGSVRDQVAFFLHGPAATGKSTFVETIFSIIGEYAVGSDIELLTPKGNEHPALIAKLIGMRMVSLPETEEGRAIAESRFKSIVDGSTLEARFMRQNFFNFQPKCKLVIHGNHRPRLKSTDESIRRRLQVVPFEEVVAPENRDPRLRNKLLAEAPQILAWMIEGCLDWLDGGLQPPMQVTGASADYFESEDVVQRFLEECAHTGMQYTTTRKIVWQRWQMWSKSQGEREGSSRRFYSMLKNHGIEDFKLGGERGFKGLQIINVDATYEERYEGGHQEPAW